MQPYKRVFNKLSQAPLAGGVVWQVEVLFTTCDYRGCRSGKLYASAPSEAEARRLVSEEEDVDLVGMVHPILVCQGSSAAN